MSYTHVLHVLSGIVHGQPKGSDYTECSKGVTSSYVDVDQPITCKVCARSIELSRDHRVARGLSWIACELWKDAASRPDAYSAWASTQIAEMKRIVEDE